MEHDQSRQLDNLETAGTSRPPTTYRKYCESHCAAELAATYEAYEAFDNAHGGKRVDSLNDCRTGAWFARNKLTGKVRIRSSSCHLRWCPMCSSTRRWFLTQEVSAWLKSVAKPKFLTLTLAHTSAPLTDQIHHLYQCFRKYRKLKLLRTNIRGGVWFFQIKKSDNDDLWHPHLHCVVDSEYINKYDLSLAWGAITITSNIIDFRTIWDTENAAGEVARYASRPAMLDNLSECDRLELLDALHGRRLVGSWGSARSIILRPSKPPDADDWINIGSWSVVSLMHDEDDRAAMIWKAYQTDGELPEDCSLVEFELELNNEQKPEIWEPVERYQAFLDFY